MKKLLFVLALLFFAPSLALAQGCGQQNPNCIVPTAPPGTNNNQAASTAFVQQNSLGSAITNGTTLTSGFTDGDLIFSSGGTTVDSGIPAVAPAGKTLCNNTGVPATPTWCDAIVAALPLTIVGTTLSANIFPLLDSTLGNSISIGLGALAHLPSSAAYSSIAIGGGSLGGASMTAAAIKNNAVGQLALGAITSGSNNDAFGQAALLSLTSGGNNTALGHGALDSITGGGNNVCIGFLVCQGAGSPNFSVVVGQQSGTAITTSGDSNTILGSASGTTITSGNHNIIVGAGITGGNTSTSGNTQVGGPATGLSGLANTVMLGDGAGNARYDYGRTTTSRGTHTGPLDVVGEFTGSTTLQGKQIYSAAGTPLPTCNGAAEGTHAGVSDATGPTYLATYVSGGTVHAPVYCNGTNWVTN